MLSEPFQVTLQVVKVFDYLGIPYLVGGSLASTVHGVLRATMDADIVADIHQDQVGELVNLLKDSFYIDPDMVCNAIQENSSFNIIHLETMFKVDIFLLNNAHSIKTRCSAEYFSRLATHLITYIFQPLKILFWQS